MKIYDIYIETLFKQGVLSPRLVLTIETAPPQSNSPPYNLSVFICLYQFYHIVLTFCNHLVTFL